jgi:hypothetical protein
MGRSQKHQNVAVIKEAHSLAMTGVIASLSTVGLDLNHAFGTAKQEFYTYAHNAPSLKSRKHDAS